MITSAQNPKIQQVRTLLGRRKERNSAQQFIVEGVRLVEEAWLAGLCPSQLFYSPEINPRGLQIISDYRQKKVDVEEISASLMNSLSLTESSQGLLAIYPLKNHSLPIYFDFLLILDALRDPGNLGTILRTAAAAGVNAVILTPGTTDAYAPKVLRAGMGAHFRLPIINMTWDEITTLSGLHSPPLQLFLAEAAPEEDLSALTRGGSGCWSLDLRQPLALIIGGEAEGVTAQARAAAQHPITIPMPGKSESLNAAVAAGILLFEVVRQRTVK